MSPTLAIFNGVHCCTVQGKRVITHLEKIEKKQTVKSSIGINLLV